MFEQTTGNPTLLADKAFEPTSSEERAAVLYSPTILPRAAEVLGMESEAGDGATRQARAVEYSQLAGDVGLDANALDVFAQVRAELEMNPPSAERAAEMRNKTHEHLVETYGERRAMEGIRAAQAMVKRNPRLRDYLNKTGAGDDYRIVARLVHTALQQRSNGKLK